MGLTFLVLATLTTSDIDLALLTIHLSLSLFFCYLFFPVIFSFLLSKMRPPPGYGRIKKLLRTFQLDVGGPGGI